MPAQKPQQYHHHVKSDPFVDVILSIFILVDIWLVFFIFKEIVL